MVSDSVSKLEEKQNSNKCARAPRWSFAHSPHRHFDLAAAARVEGGGLRRAVNDREGVHRHEARAQGGVTHDGGLPERERE